MQLTSPAFETNTGLPSKYTCDAKGVIPPLQFNDVPTEAKSLALIVHDPDAPVKDGFTHWVMWNISPQTKGIEEGKVPESGVQGHNGTGKNEWYPPCPPSGTHHYQFTLFALDGMLDLPVTSDKSALEKAMMGHIVAQDCLLGTYKRAPKK